MIEYLFVYGTLMLGVEHPMAKWLSQHSEFVGAATFRGRLYRVSTYPGVVASADPADRVTGDVLKLRNAAEVLPELDRYEACGAEFAEPTEYLRKQGTVTLASGEEIAVWIYLYNWPVDAKNRIASGTFTPTE